MLNIFTLCSAGVLITTIVFFLSDIAFDIRCISRASDMAFGM